MRIDPRRFFEFLFLMLMAMCLFFLYLRNIGDQRAVQLYSEAGRLAGDLEVLLGEGETPCRVGKLFARELFVRAGTVISRQWEHNRIAALYELSCGKEQVVVVTAEALLQKTSPPRLLREAAITLESGKRYDPAAWPSG